MKDANIELKTRLTCFPKSEMTDKEDFGCGNTAPHLKVKRRKKKKTGNHESNLNHRFCLRGITEEGKQNDEKKEQQTQVIKKGTITRWCGVV